MSYFDDRERDALANFDLHDALREAIDSLQSGHSDLVAFLRTALEGIDLALGLKDLDDYDGVAYHYTDGTAVENIVKSKTLRAFEATRTNDVSEIRQGWTWIKKWLDDQPEDDVMALMRDAMPPRLGPEGVFVLSATEVDDDAHQWRSYGGGAFGFAIGLDCSKKLLPTAPSPEPAPSGSRRAKFDISSVGPWRRVIYDETEVHKALVDLQSSIRRGNLVEIDNGGDEKEEATFDWAVRSRVSSLLEALAHLVKHPGFAGEKEVRLVATSLSKDQRHITDPSGGLRAYCEPSTPADSRVERPNSAPQPPADQLPIVSVRLGPRFAPSADPGYRDVMVARMHSWLTDSGLPDVDVSASSVPLR